MPAHNPTGMSRLDVDRAHSMADEGGAAGACVEEPRAPRMERWRAPVDGWSIAATSAACLVGLATGLGLVWLWRAR
jgi:hypothetical protein